MTHEELAIRTALSSWKLVVGRTSKAFTSLTDDQLFTPIAPGRNRPIYLWGHLTAVHDALVTILGIGERLHPELDTPFVSSPDRAVAVLPSGKMIQAYWDEVNSRLGEDFARIPAEDWLKRHMSVSDDDFAKDPMRNRLGVLISRTNHTSYHLGQVLLTAR